MLKRCSVLNLSLEFDIDVDTGSQEEIKSQIMEIVEMINSHLAYEPFAISGVQISGATEAVNEGQFNIADFGSDEEEEDEDSDAVCTFCGLQLSSLGSCRACDRPN